MEPQDPGVSRLPPPSSSSRSSGPIPAFLLRKVRLIGTRRAERSAWWNALLFVCAFSPLPPPFILGWSVRDLAGWCGGGILKPSHSINTGWWLGFKEIG